MEFIINYLLTSLPEAYLMFSLGALVIGYKFNEVKGKIFIMALIGSLVSDVMYQFKFFIDFRVMVTFTIIIVLYKLFFKLNWSLSIFITLINFAILLISELITLLLFTQFFNVEEIMNNQNVKIIFNFFYLIPIFLTVYIIHKKQWVLLEWLKYKLNNKKMTYHLIGIILLIGLQFFMIIFLNYLFYVYRTYSEGKIILNLYGLPLYSISLIFINVLLIRAIIKIKNVYTDIEISQAENNYNENLEKLLTKLRMERHDFINEIQTISGMLQAKMYEQLEEYMSDLVQSVRQLDKSIKLKNVAVSALIHNKLEQIEAKGITFKTLIETNDTFPQIKSYDLVKIVSNLLDNSIRAVTEAKIKNPFIELYWGKENNTALIQVSNNGPKINNKVIDLLFEEGYTTKKGKENSGYGLAIVKNTVHKYKGSIEVISNDNQTSFIIRFPL